MDLSGQNHPYSMGLQSWDDEFAEVLFPDSSDEAPLPWADVGQLPEEGLIDFHDIVLPMESAAEPLAAGIVDRTVSVPVESYVATTDSCQETSGGFKRQRITGKKPQKAAEPIAAASVTRRAKKDALLAAEPLAADDGVLAEKAFRAPVDWESYAKKWDGKNGRDRYRIVYRRFQKWLECYVKFLKVKNHGENTLRMTGTHWHLHSRGQ